MALVSSTVTSTFPKKAKPAEIDAWVNSKVIEKTTQAGVTKLARPASWLPSAKETSPDGSSHTLHSFIPPELGPCQGLMIRVRITKPNAAGQVLVTVEMYQAPLVGCGDDPRGPGAFVKYVPYGTAAIGALLGGLIPKRRKVLFAFGGALAGFALGKLGEYFKTRGVQ